MGGQKSLRFVFGIALAFGVLLAMTAAFPKLQSDSAVAAKTTIHRPAHYWPRRVVIDCDYSATAFTTCGALRGSSGALLSPSPPGEKAASQDQAGKSSTGDGR